MDTKRIRWGGMNWEVGTDEYTPLWVTQTTDAKLLCSTGASAPCPVMT